MTTGAPSILALGLNALGLLASACASAGAPAATTGSARFADASWDDGMAVVLAYEGRLRRYGTWRDAVVRDYLVREYLDPESLTKRDAPTPDLVPVLKVNRLVEFSTGTYDYRFLSSLHFRRDGEALFKGVGACLNACGPVFQRWDEPSGELVSDSYHEGEGRAAARLAAGEGRFADELPFVAARLPDGARIKFLPALASPSSAFRALDGDESPASDVSLGFGDACLLCEPAPDRGRTQDSATRARALPYRVLTVERDGRRTRLVADDGTVESELVHDANGFLESWAVRDEQEFRRVAVFRGPYWDRTAPADRKLLERR